MEHRPDPIKELFRLADECARVVATVADEADCALEGDSLPLVQDSFARMVRARVAAIPRANPWREQRAPESQDEYVNRVARDESTTFIRESREHIATALGKPGSLPEEQIKLMSASTLVMMEQINDRRPTESEEEYRNRWGTEWQNRKQETSHDQLVQRVAQDDAGGVLASKRRILAATLTGLGGLTLEQVRQVSAETLILIEDARARAEYMHDFLMGELSKQWVPVLAYWDSLARRETRKSQPCSALPYLDDPGDIPF